MLTPRQIAEKTENKEGLANIRAINKLYRAQDESHLWPIKNKFNVTERAIRQAREFRKGADLVYYGVEYSFLLDWHISGIINDLKNWWPEGRPMKLECNFNKNMRALFSNVNNEDKNSFYLLMTYHKSRKGGFNTEISVEQCNKMLKHKNKQFYYADYSGEAKTC